MENTQNPTPRPSHYCLPGAPTAIAYDLAWLLLTAPKERRLDLALASIMHPWQMRLAETIQDGRRTLVPVWYFEIYPGNSRYHFTHTPQSTLPGMSQILSDCVPYYSRAASASPFQDGHHRLRDWLDEKGVEYTLQYHQTLGVQLTSREGKGATEVKEPKGVTLPARSVRMAALLAQATLKRFAPDLLPYLESDVSFPPPDLTALARQENRKALYQVLLAPCMLPSQQDPECLYHEWHPQREQFVDCATLKRMHTSPENEDEDDETREEDAPEQCPCCGGFYYQLHFSQVQQEFALTLEEASRKGTLTAELPLCRNCALLEEPVRLAVRAAFLLANGKQPYSASSRLATDEGF